MRLPWLSAALWMAVVFGLNPITASAQQTIYDDHLAKGWGSYSWAKVDFGRTSPVHGGKDAISVTVAAGSYGALELRSGPLDAAKYGALTFWINGGPTGGQHNLVVKASLDGKQQGGVPIPALDANSWKYVDDIELNATQPVLTVPKAPGPPLAFTGVNLSGGEFGRLKPGIPQIFNKDFTYPRPAEFDYFAGQGVNVLRLPFHWENLQPVLNQPLVPAEADRLKAVVDGATGKGMVVLLDPHNYARFYGKTVGGPDVPDAAFADFWGRLAAQYKDNPRVWFGLMNEPHDLLADQWLGAANAAIAAIRRAGAKNLILVPGIDWTGAHSWVSGGSGDAMREIVDPQQHYLYEVHQYLDSDCSGTKPSVVSPTIGVERLREFTLWCRRHHQRGFVAEFGADGSPEAQAAVDNMLAYMEQNRDVWVGFTWWSAGPWWGDYMFTMEPKEGQDRPQMAYLRPFLQRLDNAHTQPQ